MATRAPPRCPALRRAPVQARLAAIRRARAFPREIPSIQGMAYPRAAAQAARGGRVAAARRPRPERSAFRSTVLAGCERHAARIRSRELPGHAPAARPALERELDRFAVQRLDAARVARELGPEHTEPAVHRGQIVVLTEWIERDPQTKALRERDFLFDRFARVDFVAQELG